MPPLTRLNRKIQNKIQVNSINQKSLRRNGNTGQDFAPLAQKIGGLDSVPAPNPDVEVSTNWNCSKSSRLHLLALRTRSLPRSKFLRNFCLTISFSGIFCPSDFLMIEIIHDHRMSLRDSAIRHFIIHKGTIILLSHFLSFYFKRFKVAAVMLVIDLIVKRYKIIIPCKLSLFEVISETDHHLHLLPYLQSVLEYKSHLC